jgi:hypothetical protein
VAIIKRAVTISKNPPREVVPLVGRVFTQENAENYLRNAVR